MDGIREWFRRFESDDLSVLSVNEFLSVISKSVCSGDFPSLFILCNQVFCSTDLSESQIEIISKNLSKLVVAAEKAWADFKNFRGMFHNEYKDEELQFFFSESIYCSMVFSIRLKESFEGISSEHDILLSSIYDLDLTVRSTNCLKAEGIDYIGELVQVIERDLRRAPNLGAGSMKEIKARLREDGLFLNMNVDPAVNRKIKNMKEMDNE